MARISVDPKIMHGKPCIKGTRIPVHLILDYFADGYTTEDILAEFPQLSLEDIKEALKYASQMTKIAKVS